MNERPALSDEDVEDNEGIALDDLIAIGEKVAEAADRVKIMDAAIPGARATWHFEVDGTRFKVEVTVVRSAEKPGE